VPSQKFTKFAAKMWYLGGDLLFFPEVFGIDFSVIWEKVFSFILRKKKSSISSFRSFSKKGYEIPPKVDWHVEKL
jgi:hypothetical protein